uniref:PGAP2-interacting protein-like n=1 Tax=Saccoglossus kowalevskii TaxID=10224 RepID=A0ABM0MI59_SACKO|nr:PREDICTED: PGAP2-interacting protein-like [Saccoglossus kowalevskii]
MQMQKKNGRAEQKTTKDEEGPHRSDTNRLVALSFIRPLLTEAVIGYVFWTVLHAPPCYGLVLSTQVMEISGYEAVGVIWVISPLLCGIGPLFRFLQTKYGLLLLRLGLVCSLASFQFSNIIIRLLVLTAVLALVTLIGIGGFVPRFMSEQFIAEPQKSDPKTFSTMMWSVRFMYDNNGWPSFDRAATVLNNTEADFISFLESDASKPFLGNNDITMWMSEKLGMYSDFGPSTASHTWGSNLFSKYQIVRSSHHILPSPHGELGPAIFATVNISGTLVDLLTAHNGNYEDSLDRKLQTEYIANITRNSTNPLVYMGYVTSKPGERDYKQLTTRGRLKDIDETDRKRFCLYIMYRGLIRVGYARISHGGLTDTEIQLAKFRIPDNPNKYQDNNYITIQSEDVDPSVRFPTVFGKHYHTHWWGKGNYYHMNTPKYFIKRKPGA